MSQTVDIPYQVQVVRSARPSASALSKAGLKKPILPSGLPYLHSKRTSAPVVEVLAFLRSKCISSFDTSQTKGSPNSADAYVRDLCDFYDFLDHARTSLGNASPQTLRDYVASMYGVVSPATGKTYALDTITRRLSTVRSFLLFCQKKGWLKHRFEVQAVQVGKKSFEVLEPGIAQDLTETDDLHVKHIASDDLALLLSAIGEWGEVEDGLPTSGSRDRLVAELVLQAGLRRSEPLGLKVAQFPPHRLENVDPCSTIEIRVLGKGSKWRGVPVPVWLARAISKYILGPRRAAIERRRAWDPCFVDHGYVFVHGEDARGDWGDRLNARQVTRLFAAARSKAIELAPEDGDRGAAQRARIKRIQFHAFRHTFALLTFSIRQQMGDRNPSRHVQIILGHTFQSTTERLYLAASHVHEAELSEMVQKSMMAMVKGNG